MRLLTGLLLGFLLLAPLTAMAANKTVIIGDTTVLLPMLDGFQEVYGKSPDFDKLVEKFVPEGNRLLAVYLSDQDVAAMSSDPQAGMQKYILVQTNAEDLTINTPTDFNTVKEDFANQIGSGSWQADKSVSDAMDQVSGYMRNQYDPKAQLKIGDTKYLGKIADTPEDLSVVMLTNYGVQTSQGMQSYPVAAGLSALNLRAKVLTLFVYSNFTGQPDIDFVAGTTRKFVSAAISLNSAVPPRKETTLAPPMPAEETPAEPQAAAPQGKAPPSVAPPLVSRSVPEVSPPATTEPPQPENTDEEKPPEHEADIGGAMQWATKWAVLIALLAVVALLAPKFLRDRDERR
jgi:hypothetical protein